MKRTYSLKIEQTFAENTARLLVLRVLFDYPDKEFSLSELAKEAGVSKSNIGPFIQQLIDSDSVKVEKLSRIWRIKANMQNSQFRMGKIVNNFERIYNCNFVEVLNELYRNPKAIVLFGSYRWGTDVSNSDIDIAIESPGLAKAEVEQKQELLPFENAFKRHINILLFDRKSADIHVFNNIANGIVLSGFLEVNP